MDVTKQTLVHPRHHPTVHHLASVYQLFWTKMIGYIVSTSFYSSRWVCLFSRFQEVFFHQLFSGLESWVSQILLPLVMSLSLCQLILHRPKGLAQVQGFPEFELNNIFKIIINQPIQLNKLGSCKRTSTTERCLISFYDSCIRHMDVG